jgi:hypothetical protein
MRRSSVVLALLAAVSPAQPADAGAIASYGSDSLTSTLAIASPVSVPEPGIALLLALALGALLAARRR